MEAKTISLKTGAISIAAILFIEIGFRSAMGGRVASSLTALGLIRCLESILLLVIAFAFEKGLESIGLSRSKILAGLMKGLIWSACFGVAAGVLFLVLTAAGINALDLLQGPGASSWQQMFILLLVGGVIGPIAEEIFFRGIIFGLFRQWGAIAAIILSTLIFVVIHPAGTNLPVTQLVGGIVFASAYERERNLMVPITIHCLGNLAIFSLTILS
jgi:membrane protease YdiL (CAAX protease family)